MSSDKSTLTYTQQKVFHFDAANSAAGTSEDDVICTVNLPLVVSGGIEYLLIIPVFIGMFICRDL